MLKRLSTSILFILVLSLALGIAGCDSSKETEAPVNKTATAAAPPVDPAISYGDGFYPLERDGANSWRWMSSEGSIKLKNSKSEMKLTLAGGVPANIMAQKPTIKVIFNGEQLDQFVGGQNMSKEYSIPAAKQSGKEYSELKIVTDKVFVPKEADKASADERKLGFSLTKVEWAAK